MKSVWQKNPESMSQQSLIEEALEYLWLTRDQGSNKVEDFRRNMVTDNQPEVDDSVLSKMEGDGLIIIKDGHFKLSREGESQAEQVVRRHRLAERLFSDLMNVPMQETEKIACELEHILNAEVTDTVCTFLGHPPFCPHGRKIPRGQCCKRLRKDVKPLITSVRRLELRTPAKIAFITPKFHKRFERLTSLGVTPGTELMITQRHPSIVLRIGETEIAVDEEIADEIYVKRLSN